MTPVDTLGEPVTVVDALGEPVVLINEDGTPAFLAYSAKTYLGGVAPYHWLDFINNRALYAGADVGNVTQATGYSFTRASDGYYTNSDGTLTLFGSGALRRGDRGVLIEGSRTNLLVRSQEFDNAAWTKNQATITANDIAAPDGTLTADRITASGTTAYAQQVFTSSTGVTYTTSVFLKAGNISSADLYGVNQGVVAYTARFTLTGAGTATAIGGSPTVGILALANGWYFCWMTKTHTTGSASDLVQVVPGNEGATVASDYVYAWQADLQAGAFPSSPIVTVAAAATRASDVLTYTAGVSYPLSLWAEWEKNGDDGVSFPEAISLFTASNPGDNRSSIYQRHTNGAVRGLQRTSAVTVADVGTRTVALNTVVKAAARFSADNFASSVNGQAAETDTSGSVPSAPNTIQIGAIPTGAAMFGHIRRAAIFNSALTDAQLQTTTGS
jgi:hypothetical protein